MYKAIFLDLDGTLLDNEKNISEENINAIKMAKTRNIIVCICSGRSIDITRKYKEIANASNYMICSNGAFIYDDEKNEEIFSSSIDKKFCKDVFDYAERNCLTVRLDTTYGRFTNNKKYSAPTEKLIEEGINNFLEKNRVIQLSLSDESIAKIDKSIDELEIKNNKNINLGNKYLEKFPVKHFCFNCVNNSVSKGDAMLKLCKHLKIDLKDVIAIGDELNDLSMIEIAGLGVAMGNAFAEVKAIANEITKTNTENGVAYIINKYIV